MELLTSATDSPRELVTLAAAQEEHETSGKNTQRRMINLIISNLLVNDCSTIKGRYIITFHFL